MLVVADCLIDFFADVHHEGAVLHDRLAERRRGEQQKSCAGVARHDHEGVTLPENTTMPFRPYPCGVVCELPTCRCGQALSYLRRHPNAQQVVTTHVPHCGYNSGREAIPQTYSMDGIINSALRLSRRWEECV